MAGPHRETTLLSHFFTGRWPRQPQGLVRFVGMLNNTRTISRIDGPTFEQY
jgi:hypothetical protein